VSNASPNSADANPWIDAVDRYREVAKWLIAAFGAIGAVIAGTAPLAGVGNLRTDRVGYVVAGGVTALSGVAIVLAGTVAVLAPRAVYRHQLRAARQGPLRRAFVGLGHFENLLAAHPADLLPPGLATVDQLDQAIANLTTACNVMAARAAALPPNSAARAEHQQQAQALNALRIGYQNDLLTLVYVARYEQARTRFNQTVVAVLAGGIATAAGLALTLYGIAHQAVPAPSTVRTHSAPTAITVVITPTFPGTRKPASSELARPPNAMARR
jgi:hypothetical protein